MQDCFVVPSKCQGVPQPRRPFGTCGTLRDLCNLRHEVLTAISPQVSMARWPAQCNTTRCGLTESGNREPGDGTPRPASNRGLPTLCQQPEECSSGYCARRWQRRGEVGFAVEAQERRSATNNERATDIFLPNHQVSTEKTEIVPREGESIVSKYRKL